LRRQLEELEARAREQRRQRPAQEALERVSDFLRGFFRGLDLSAAVAVSMFYDPSSPYYQQHLAPKVEEAGPAEQIIGRLGGMLGLVMAGNQLLGQAGQAAMMFPQVAARVPQVSP